MAVNSPPSASRIAAISHPKAGVAPAAKRFQARCRVKAGCVSFEIPIAVKGGRTLFALIEAAEAAQCNVGRAASSNASASSVQ